VTKHDTAAHRALLDELRRGVTPTQGILDICVGRDPEKAALFDSIKTAVAGDYAFRVVAGQYGSGKTFLMELMRAVGRSKRANLLTMRAEMSPEKLLVGAKTQRDDLWQDLVGSLTAGPDGEPGLGQLQRVLDAFVKRVETEAASGSRWTVVDELLAPVRMLPHGPQVADVVRKYVKAVYDDKAHEVHRDVTTWLAGGYPTTMEARRAIGNGRFEAGTTDRLRILAALARCAGWNGLFVCIDEMDKLLKLPMAVGRKNLLEVHAMIDLNKARAPGMCLFLSGAPSFVDDTRRGLFSLESVRQKLSDNEFLRDANVPGLVDYRRPVLRLDPLTVQQSHELLHKLRTIYLGVHTSLHPNRVPDAAVAAYLQHCQSFVGAETHLRPRHTIRSFVGLLDILDQNPQARWQDLLKGVRVERELDDIGNPADSERDDLRI